VTTGAAGSQLPADDIQGAALSFWLEHPLLGPLAWLRDSASASATSPRSSRPGNAPPRGCGVGNAALGLSVFAPRRCGAQESERRSSDSAAPSLTPSHTIWTRLGLVTRSDALRDVLHLAETYASGSMPVLILGETGTGKDLLAQGIHALSGRKGRFVPVNCAAAQRELFVAELFGARRGAYTGALENRQGLIREAEGGTLFLDEIADLDREAQGYLLRFLDSGEVRPLGESRSFHVETRVVAATRRDLSRMVARGRMRRDLFARLAAVVLRLPPLREREEDLELLIATLWARHGGTPDDRALAFSPRTIDSLHGRPWPGNVRDLSHAVAQAVLLTRAGKPLADVERTLEGAGQVWEMHRTLGAPGAARARSRPSAWAAGLSREERRAPGALRRALDEAEGSIPEAARILGLSRSHAYRLYRPASDEDAASVNPLSPQ